jgi:hypothetical protein
MQNLGENVDIVKHNIDCCFLPRHYIKEKGLGKSA